MKPDTPEMIQSCLKCKKERCTNCLDPSYATKGTNGRKPVTAYREDEEDMLFDCAADAADFFHVSPQAIRQAIRGKHRCQGYLWRYA